MYRSWNYMSRHGIHNTITAMITSALLCKISHNISWGPTSSNNAKQGLNDWDLAKNVGMIDIHVDTQRYSTSRCSITETYFFPWNHGLSLSVRKKYNYTAGFTCQYLSSNTVCSITVHFSFCCYLLVPIWSTWMDQSMATLLMQTRPDCHQGRLPLESYSSLCRYRCESYIKGQTLPWRSSWYRGIHPEICNWQSPAMRWGIRATDHNCTHPTSCGSSSIYPWND